jgi:CubicO group peptidase (beta-lactamase class C family)
MFWPGTDLSAGDIVYRLRFLPLGGGFRAAYAYDNVLYNVIGAVVEKVSGESWQRFIRERFFEPLGMTSSLTSVQQIKPGDDAASPHAMNDGVLKALEYMPIDNIAPAGSLVSSAGEMARWVLTLLNKGITPDGKRLLSEEQVNVLSTPLVVISGRSKPAPELQESTSNFTAYAMGEFISEYRGEYQVAHTGGILGMYTAFTMLPDHNLGVVVLTNQQEGGAIFAIEYSILDHYLKAPAKNWVEAYVTRRSKRIAGAKKTMSEGAANRSAASMPSLPLAAYAGRYRDPWYGDVLVSESGGQLTMRFTHSPLLSGRLEHWQHDTFVVRWKDRSLDADAYVTFWLGPDAKVERVRMKAVSPLTDFGFDFHDLRLTPVAANAPPWD